MSYQGVSPISFEPVTTVTATASVEVGTRRTKDGVDYVYAYNEGGSSIETGKGCVLAAGATGMSCTVSSVTAADCLIGVSVNTMATTKYGWLVTRGITNVEMNPTSGTVAAGEGLILGLNGVFNRIGGTDGATAGVGANLVGKALAAIVSGASGSAYVKSFG